MTLTEHDMKILAYYLRRSFLVSPRDLPGMQWACHVATDRIEPGLPAIFHDRTLWRMGVISQVGIDLIEVAYITKYDCVKAEAKAHRESGRSDCCFDMIPLRRATVDRNLVMVATPLEQGDQHDDQQDRDGADCPA